MTAKALAAPAAGSRKHTPGPWRVSPSETTSFGVRVVADDKLHHETIADLRDTPNARANAKLIAAAPALADALEALVGPAGDLHSPGNMGRALAALRDAGRLTIAASAPQAPPEKKP